MVALKVAFLAVMWLFILFIANVVRTDLFGRRVKSDEITPDDSKAASKRGTKHTKAALTRVIVVTGRGEGRFSTLPQIGQQITIGRSAACTLDVGDDYASGQHAKIWRDDEGWVIEDLASTNGTYVNGHKISQPTRIEADDIIRIGRSQLQLEA